MKANIETDQASNIGWAILLFEKYINEKDIINPINKLPPSPKNNFGVLNNPKLKIKKIIRGIRINSKKNLIS